MLPSQLIAPADAVVDLKAGDKTQLLRDLAERLSVRSGVSSARIASAFAAREVLGSTGIGGGVALPHARVAGARRTCALFARLARPIDFAAVDGRPVDLVCAILAPENARPEALSALAAVSRVLRDATIVERLRKVPDGNALHELLTTADLAATTG